MRFMHIIFEAALVRYVFLGWIFILVSLMVTERTLYYIQQDLSRADWKRYSGLAFTSTLMLKFGAILLALAVFYTIFDSELVDF
jgi:uncharacterized membrane protein YcjF (UPF0283 family)